MNTTGNLLTNLRTLLCCVRETLGYALIFLWAIFCHKAVLAAKLLAVESQLAVCKHQIGQRKRRRPRFTASFRLLWVVLSKSLDKWEDLVHLMQPATVKKWHTTTFPYFWRWKSRRKGGRPPISKEMQNLIYKLSKENPLMASLAWTLKAWFALLLPEKGRWKEKYKSEKQAVLKMEFKRFRNAIIALPCQIINADFRTRN